MNSNIKQNPSIEKKVFVSGCFDLLHSGHVAFFREAAAHGDVYVGIGSDKTIKELKNRTPVNKENERLFMVQSLRYVKDAWINKGSGYLDFLDQLKELSPDLFFVNQDGHSPEKEELCSKLGIRYVVSNRIPHKDLPKRSTTALRNENNIPYRIDLAGGWLDQPFVSKYAEGPVVTISIEPDFVFNDRSGMSTSTRKKAIELWGSHIPNGDKLKQAKMLFCFENEPGSEYISGSQDSLGIVLPGLNRLQYSEGRYWPSEIHSENSDEILSWLEDHIQLKALNPRGEHMNVLCDSNVTEEGAQKLAEAASRLWQAALRKDKLAFGRAMKDSYEAQIKMFPNMVTEEVKREIESIKHSCFGYKLSGAGGGGYLVLFTDIEFPETKKIRIRKS